ncbi:MAG TPA: phenylalanine--tRNA ligase subunit beta [Pyrinomonadaceae bacterium]|nr:phenylalanine--tRNA ligase subunit beta [Pyrinomonadaceae bacterium]
MFISYNWLRELTGTSLPPLDVRERLTMVGLAIDAVDQHNGDYVLDVEVPSNRPDCLSHLGIAREVTVIESSHLRPPTPIPPSVEGRAERLTSVEIRDPRLCRRYAARIVRGVKIGPSPEWLRSRLEEIGQRPINNVADITNYVLHELGQPLHAFDFTKLTDQRIVVRTARPGEKLRTLDGIDRVLDSEMLVIADATRAVALAGIMGGEETEISETTTDVLIESAYFDPDSVRRTARKLGMDTEASRRFERGADCENVLQAQTRCIELICEIAGGVATENAVDVYPDPLQPRQIDLRPERVEDLTSLSVSRAEMVRILTALGFVERQTRANGRLSFLAPSWRVDTTIEEDLIEEISRHTGYDKIAAVLPPANTSGEYQSSETKRRALRRVLSHAGFDEAINFSFIEPDQVREYEYVPGLIADDTPERQVTLSNPIVGQAALLRPTLLPGLLQSIRHNLNQNIRDVRLFEIGRVFGASQRGELPLEREALALAATGGATEEGRAQATRELDFYDLKGALEAAAGQMRLGRLRFVKAHVKHLREGQAARVLLPDGSSVGTIGRLVESIAGTYKFRQPVYVAELDLSALHRAEERAVVYRPLPRYPAVFRDVTLLMNRQVPILELLETINEQQVEDLRTVNLVGIYEGPNIPKDKRSVTVRLEYRADDRTLRDEEVEERHHELIDSLLNIFTATLH